MSTVPLASSYARRLVEHEQRQAGTNMRDAAKAVARRLKRPPGAVWNLLFRAPKSVCHDLYLSLEAAVERKIEREIGDLEHELAQLKAGRRRLGPGVVEEAEASLARLRAALREDA